MPVADTPPVALPPQSTPIRVLALDGGFGCLQNLSSLTILRELMEQVAVKQGIEPNSVRPYDYFDLIVGTGTGGILALFLGHLRMTVVETILEYQRLADVAIKSTTCFASDLRDSDVSRSLDRCFCDIVQRFLKSRDALFVDDDSATCHTAVLACTSADPSTSTYIFRSYATAQPYTPFPIHDVARAAIATAGISPSILLGNPAIRFIRAGPVGYSNPAEIALHEAAQIWRTDNIHCLVSLGHGHGKNVQGRTKQTGVITACEKITHSCERVHQRAYHICLVNNVTYFRLKATHGLESDGARLQSSSANHIAGIITDYTREHLEPQLIDSFSPCVQTLTREVTSTKTMIKIGEAARKSHPVRNPAPKFFHGRKVYIEQAVTMLVKQPAAHLCILGPNGIGKTAIALTVLHEGRVKHKFGDHSWFVPCDGITSSASLVDILCTIFDLQDLSADRQRDLLLYLTQVYKNKPLLLILDNFETIWDVTHARPDSETFLMALGQVPSLSIVLTMKGKAYPAGLPWTSPCLPLVGGLTPDVAHQVFLDISQVKDDKLDKLLSVLDYMPLAITLMAHLGPTVKPAQLLYEWYNVELAFKLVTRPYEWYHLDKIKLLIQIMLESPQMQSTPGAYHLLTVIALLPSGIHINDLPDIMPRLYRQDLAVATLCDLGLAYSDTLEVIHVLSPIRTYITQYHSPDPDFLLDLNSYYFKLSALGRKNPAEDGYEKVFTTLIQAETNIEAILTKALLEGTNIIRPPLLAALDWTHFLEHNRPRRNIIQLAVNLARTTDINDLLAQSLQSLGNIEFKLDHYEVAQQILLAAQMRFVSIGDQQGVAQCLQKLGEIQHVLGHNEAAHKMLSTALDMFESLGDKLGVLHNEKLLMKVQGGPRIDEGLENSILADSVYWAATAEPFSKHSELCLDGQITNQSRFVKASGGNADVWSGLLDGHTVAIKVMRAFSSNGPRIHREKLIKRLWREYLAWSHLSHPNILPCLGFSYDFTPEAEYQVPSLISHWMSNGTVLSYIEMNPNVNCIDLLAGIADGLAYLHNRDPVVIHGDIRGGNILVSDTGIPYLTDFGLSRIIGETRGMSTSSDVAGSLRWMSPELFRAEKLSKKSDVWAFGMTVLEILSGKRPYDDIRLEPLVLQHILDGRTPTRPVHCAAPSAIADRLWAVCQSCWHLQPDLRPSMNEVIIGITLSTTIEPPS